MAKWKEGDRVRVVSRPVTEEDRKKNRYFEHMAGLVGEVQYVYAEGLYSVRVEPETLSKTSANVHREAAKRMRAKFLENTGEEQRKQLTSEELNFPVNFNLIVDGADLESAK